MSSASILSLNDDCLLHIMPNIDDPRSFYSFAVTCSRLFKLSLTEQSWHINVAKKKMEYHAQTFLREIRPKPLMYLNLKSLVRGVERAFVIYKIIRPTLDNVLKIWRTRGPVAAEVFTWITDVECTDSREAVTQIYFNEHIDRSRITLYLPQRCERIKIFTTFDHRDDAIILTIDVSLGSRELTVSGHFSVSELMYFTWSEERLSKATKLLQPAIDMIQDELGETSPSINGNFLLWFCFLPNSLFMDQDVLNRNDPTKLYFSNGSRNNEPTIHWIQPSLQRFDNMADDEWEMKNICESKHVKKMLKSYNRVRRAEQFHNKVSQDTCCLAIGPNQLLELLYN